MYILALKKSVSGLHILVYRIYFFVMSFGHLFLVVILHLLEQVDLRQQGFKVLSRPILHLIFRPWHVQLVLVLLSFLHSPSGPTVIIWIQFDTVYSIFLDIFEFSSSESILNKLFFHLFDGFILLFHIASFDHLFSFDIFEFILIKFALICHFLHENFDFFFLIIFFQLFDVILHNFVLFNELNF